MNTATTKTRGRPASGVGTPVQVRLQETDLAYLDEMIATTPGLKSRASAIRALISKHPQRVMVTPAIPIGDRLNRAAQMVIQARVHADIWLTYEERGADYIAAADRYYTFIPFDLHAHRVAAVIALVNLSDDRADIIGLPQLVRELESTGHIERDNGQEMRARLAGMTAAKKLKRIRNKAFAHRDDSISLDDVMSAAKLTPNEVRRLSLEMLKLVNAMLAAFGLPTTGFRRAVEETQEVIKRLGST